MEIYRPNLTKSNKSAGRERTGLAHIAQIVERWLALYDLDSESNLHARSTSCGSSDHRAGRRGRKFAESSGVAEASYVAPGTVEPRRGPLPAPRPAAAPLVASATPQIQTTFSFIQNQD